MTISTESSVPRRAQKLSAAALRRADSPLLTGRMGGCVRDRREGAPGQARPGNPVERLPPGMREAMEWRPKRVWPCSTRGRSRRCANAARPPSWPPTTRPTSTTPPRSGHAAIHRDVGIDCEVRTVQDGAKWRTAGRLPPVEALDQMVESRQRPWTSWSPRWASCRDALAGGGHCPGEFADPAELSGMWERGLTLDAPAPVGTIVTAADLDDQDWWHATHVDVDEPTSVEFSGLTFPATVFVDGPKWRGASRCSCLFASNWSRASTTSACGSSHSPTGCVPVGPGSVAVGLVGATGPALGPNDADRQSAYLWRSAGARGLWRPVGQAGGRNRRS